MVQARWLVRRLKTLGQCGAVKSRTHIIKSVGHAPIMQTVGFQSQAHEKDKRIHESVHCNPWGLLIDLSVQLLARADTMAISGNYLYQLNFLR
jgi:hypothetical protein